MILSDRECYYRDTLILAAFNEATCLISGFVIFSVIGFMAKTEGRSIAEVADSGNNLNTRVGIHKIKLS